MLIYVDCVLCKVFYFRNVSIMHPVLAQLRIHYLISLFSPSLSLFTTSLYVSLNIPSLYFSLSLSSHPLCFCFSLSLPSIYFSIFPFLSLFPSFYLSCLLSLSITISPLSVFSLCPPPLFLSLSYFPLSVSVSLYFFRHFISLSDSNLSLYISLLISLAFSLFLSFLQPFHKLDWVDWNQQNISIILIRLPASKWEHIYTSLGNIISTLCTKFQQFWLIFLYSK